MRIFDYEMLLLAEEEDKIKVNAKIAWLADEGNKSHKTGYKFSRKGMYYLQRGVRTCSVAVTLMGDFCPH